MSIEIYPAYNELDNVRALFTEYAKWLEVDLCFQSFEEELKTLPGLYALPKGRLYLARYMGELAGCAALKPAEDNNCEMKRLYVRREYRGHKIGKILIEKIIDDAKDMKYNTMKLDTLASLKEAISLYRYKGFYETEPYYENPLENAIFMALDLQ
ncbi:MAG TPA: GNAT family N-acetyltransferase [Anaerovoracaceae bacterium]|nr:GNAT family N-acetyltransferase [Anaerovoracaceae bacterium]